MDRLGINSTTNESSILGDMTRVQNIITVFLINSSDILLQNVVIQLLPYNWSYLSPTLNQLPTVSRLVRSGRYAPGRPQPIRRNAPFPFVDIGHFVSDHVEMN